MAKICFLLSVFISFFSAASVAAEKTELDTLDKKIDAVLKEFNQNIDLGIFVVDGKSGKVLYQKNVDRYFMPASNQKLFTAYAALQYLGPDYTYRTTLFADYTKMKNGRLEDNLYLQFSGDPTFTFPQFDLLVNSLTQAGVRQIKGNVIIDDSAFDQMVMSPGTSWDDADYCWGAPISALIVNHNCVSVTLSPADKPGLPAKVELPNFPQSMEFVNQVVTGEATTKGCTIKAKRSDNKTYALTGCIKVNSKPQLIDMAIDNPRDNIRFLLNYLLAKNQIAVKGKIEFKSFQSAAKPFAVQVSPPLKMMVITMLKESDNMIANALFKTIGADYAHDIGTFAKGSKAVREIISQSTQLQLPKRTLIDGAGLSRYNFLTPEQIMTLLQKIFVSPSATDFIASLAIAGVDGTLKERLNTSLTRGKIFAKTGSATAVSNLAGFVKTDDNQTLLFVFMINGYADPAAKYIALEDKLCKVLL